MPITYDDKDNTQPTSDPRRKVRDIDLNEIKSVVNSNETTLGTKAPLANPTFTGNVNGITKSMVGLGNVDNTSDVNKPISNATQSALNLKTTTTNFATRVTPAGDVDGVNDVFTLPHDHVSGSECVFKNGMLQDDGTDYTIVDDEITFATPPGIGDKILVNYIRP